LQFALEKGFDASSPENSPAARAGLTVHVARVPAAPFSFYFSFSTFCLSMIERSNEDLLMKTRFHLLAAAMTFVALVAFIAATSPVSAQDSTVIKIATLHPADSGVGRVFQVWAKAVDSRTNGAVQLDFDWTSGDESSLIGRMKDGSLDGALLTSSGLSQVSQPIQRFEIPGIGGGIMISSKSLKKLSEEQRAVLVETANVAAKNLTKALPK
jgi:TRAP-type C4-dicarboxylate transport system substrate-binding protein